MTMTWKDWPKLMAAKVKGHTMTDKPRNRTWKFWCDDCQGYFDALIDMNDMERSIAEVSCSECEGSFVRPELDDPRSKAVSADKPTDAAMRAARAVAPKHLREDTARKIDRETRLPEKETALRAVLMFHSGAAWDYQSRHDWFNLTQSSEATTKILCDVVRAALKGT